MQKLKAVEVDLSVTGVVLVFGSRIPLKNSIPGAAVCIAMD
jgi:hypothetical protein